MSLRILAIALTSFAFPALLSAATPNLLLITVDDMNCDSIGAFGCPLPDISPNVDKLAASGLRFEKAHVQVGNCYPSRNVMWSGRFSHNTGVEGFYQVKPTDYPHLVDVMQKAGYWVGIRGKVSHSTPYLPYHWDDDLTVDEDGNKEHIKDVESYGRSTSRGIEKAKTAGKPFCLNINISDPHKPFWHPKDPHSASREYTAEEVPVPGFLPDDPAIREELALYYTSVRRADDAVGSILDALEKSGEAENTFVMFLSDHGMPLPFAKTQLYHHSTRTPLIVKWPGVTRPGTVDSEHLVSAVDFLPTLCDVVETEFPKNMDGKSFAKLIKGETENGWESVFKIYNENSGGNRHPIRGVETAGFLYLFNPWSDGENKFKTATQGTVSYRRLQQLAQTDKAIAARLELFDHRVVEEFYDVKNDPDCLVNLIQSEKHADELARHRALLEKWMKDSGDHALPAFEGREDPAVLTQYIDKVSAEANARRAAKRKGKNKGKAPAGKKGKGKNGAKKA